MKSVSAGKIVCMMMVLAILCTGVAFAATTGESNALRSANSYLNFMPFSYSGLIGQLEYEGYSTSEATYAADNCGADWNEQAVLKAASYLDFMSFSRDRLVEQLEYEGFTRSQAEYGADFVFELGSAASGSSDASFSQQNALNKALDYLDFMAFSYKGLIKQLEYEQFSHEDAVYAADNCGADWDEQAAKKAEEYMSFSSFSRSQLIKQLEYEGFTNSQAKYGAKAVGY